MTLVQAIPQIAAVGFLGLILAAAVHDARSLTIPNRFCLAIALLYPAWVLSVGYPVDWIGALAVAAVTLVIGFTLFTLRLLGGGDAKLLAAVALWAGPSLIVPFLLFTGLAGGGLAAFVWLRPRLTLIPAAGIVLMTPANTEFGDQTVPYGVAIAAGAAYVGLSHLGVI